MRFTSALPALALVVLSSQNPTSRQSLPPPCQEIADHVASLNSTEIPTTSATTAYNCLTSMPFNATASVSFIQGMKKFFQFQSTLAFAADPPPTSYGREPVDIMKGFDSIAKTAENSGYKNHYEFEADIRILLRKLHDGHVSWQSNCLEGIFLFFHRFPIIALANSPDDIPKIYGDIPIQITSNDTFVVKPTPDYKISAIYEIDGIPVNKYLSDWVETTDAYFHDPDTRWNSLFIRRVPGRFTRGLFTVNNLYQGDSFTVTFENGTKRTIPWEAQINTDFKSITSGEDLFYKNCLADTYVGTPTTDTNQTTATPSVTAAPTPAATQAQGYPLPLDIARDRSVSTYTLGNNTGVILVQTYLEPDNEGGLMFQAFISKAISDFKYMGIEKVIIDVTSNSGGSIVLGYDMFKQFFPDIEPFAATNMRAHPAAEVFYNVISEKINTAVNESELIQYITDPFSYHKRDVNDVYFQTWEQAYGPIESYNDTFTNLTRWDLVAQEAFGWDFNVTNGDGTRNASYITPWDAENIVILGDGTCASTCTIFTEAMKEVGVRTFVYGGRPQQGPMQMIGGVEGGQVYDYESLIEISELALETHPEKADEWTKFLPAYLDFVPFQNDYSKQSINLRNAFRPNMSPDMDTPLEFVYDAADYRVQITREYFEDVTALWSEVASRVWYK